MPNKKNHGSDPAEAQVPVITISRQALEETPARVLPLLRGIGTTPAIRALMATRGYTEADHDEGWDLLHAVSGYSTEPKPTVVVDVVVRDAIATLDNEDEDIFRIVGGALRRLHPKQAEFVLEGIGPSVGPAAVVGVKKLLQRLDALENSPARKATRKDDHAALATLAKRQFDAKERKRLAALVKQAEGIAEMPADDTERTAREEQRIQGLVALRAWFDDWSSVARVVVKRRDYLIRLGLAKRKMSATAKAKAKKAPATKTVAATEPKDAAAKPDGATAAKDASTASGASATPK